MKPDKSQPKPFSVRKCVGSFRHAWNGIRLAFASEHNLRIHLLAGILVVMAGFYFNINNSDWIVLIFAMALVLAMELINSAIEMLADFISPGHHQDIGKIKDIAAAAVLIVAIGAFSIGIFVFLPYVKMAFPKN